MKLVVITGLIASGKSTFENLLKKQIAGVKDLRCEFLDADILARKTLQRGTREYGKIVEFFGSSILYRDKLSRRKIFKIISFDLKKQQKLNSIVHPYVRNCVLREVKAKGNSLDYLFYTVPYVREDFWIIL